LTEADTIAAISTPLGEGGIGIVRLSGPEAVAIADRIFVSPRGLRARAAESFMTYYGRVRVPDDSSAWPPNDPGLAAGQEIDEALLTVMRAPRTYTREDVVELSCHGGIGALRQVLQLTLALGARLAEPGEFTRRAFLNGRIDLAQAEAVLDVIRAKTAASLRAAVEQLGGKLSAEVRRLKERVLELLVHLEVSLDFVEEGLETRPRAEVAAAADRLAAEARALAQSAEQGRRLREGLVVVIAGRPNVGKSSLMNCLLREQRVIVTSLPGTTRDVIEEVVNLRGLALRIVDTAGLRTPGDVIEEQGVAHSRRSLARADLVLLVLDGAEPLQAEDRALLRELPEGRPLLLVVNKCDLPLKMELEELRRLLPGAEPVRISALEGTGLEELQGELLARVWRGEVVGAEGAMVTNLRHQQALLKAAEALGAGARSLAEGESEEFAAFHLARATEQLGGILGENVGEEVIEKIFADFCVGK
jgi:tRNA modification GTPase